RAAAVGRHSTAVAFELRRLGFDRLDSGNRTLFGFRSTRSMSPVRTPLANGATVLAITHFSIGCDFFTPERNVRCHTCPSLRDPFRYHPSVVMPHRVLFIEDGPLSLGQECSSVLNLSPQFAPWASAFPNQVREHALDLIVAVAVPSPPSARDF